MSIPLPITLALSALLSLPLLAGAQGVWRCGPDGRTYSDAPCTEGRQVALTEARPAADIQSAQQQAVRERHLAQTLRRERLAQEAAQRGNGLASLGPQTDTLKPRERDRDRLLAKERPTSRSQARRATDGSVRAVAASSRRTKD